MKFEDIVFKTPDEVVGQKIPFDDGEKTVQSCVIKDGVAFVIFVEQPTVVYQVMTHQYLDEQTRYEFGGEI